MKLQTCLGIHHLQAVQDKLRMFLDPLRQRRDQVLLFRIDVGVPAESRVSNCLIVMVACTTHDDIVSRAP